MGLAQEYQQSPRDLCPDMRNSFDHRTAKLRRKLSHLVLNCQTKVREFILDSGASLHMMSKDALTLGERETIRKLGELTIIMTANGMARSMAEATVYGNDSDVFVTVMLL